MEAISGLELENSFHKDVLDPELFIGRIHVMSGVAPHLLNVEGGRFHERSGTSQQALCSFVL